MKKDINIQLIRIISMILILVCHFCNEMTNAYANALAQIFNVGVFIFLFISGYLFGKKDINNVKDWYIKRALRIFIPLWIWTAFVNIIYVINGVKIQPENILAYTLNLQGFFGATNGLEHLWFLTLIMMCYLITPVLYRISRKINIKKCNTVILILFAVSVAISFVHEMIGRYMFECLLYVFAYFYSYNEEKFSFQSIKSLYLIILTVFSIGIRILFKNIMDDTVIYTNLIVLATQSIIAICMFTITKKWKIHIKNRFMLNLIDVLDKLSLYVYIVHYVFCIGPIEIVKGNTYILEILATVIISYVFAIILYIISEGTIKMLLNKKLKKNIM